jgi:hypothetical protein
MNHDNCIEIKDKPLTYKRCECGLWCPLDPNDHIKVERRGGKGDIMKARREAKKDKLNSKANCNSDRGG